VAPEALVGPRRAVAAGLSRVGAQRAAGAVAAGPGSAGVGPRPDVVVINTAGSVRALPALGAPPRRLVSHVHELATGLDYWLAPELRRQVLEDADEIWVVADAVGDHLVERYGVDRALLRTHRGVMAAEGPEPLDVEARARHRAGLGVPPEALLVGASGTLDWRKAPDLLLEVAARAAARSPIPIHVAWIGGDPDNPWGRYLAAGAGAMGLADRVHHLPEADRPDRWFGALDVFLLPSREDAYPLVCIEAAAVGVPLVTFASGGAAELVRDGGGVVVPFPDVAAAAAAIVRYAEDPAARAAAGREARAVADRHTVAVALPSLVADLHRVAGR
ncbi:MAG: glycosyltransferase family 4 protein, partial [Actinobacteria bacterium]|nr:glycosyltransferase family 4 protein [Actinomycetota bacterium]